MFDVFARIRAEVARLTGRPGPKGRGAVVARRR